MDWILLHELSQPKKRRRREYGREIAVRLSSIVAVKPWAAGPHAEEACGEIWLRGMDLRDGGLLCEERYLDILGLLQVDIIGEKPNPSQTAERTL